MIARGRVVCEKEGGRIEYSVLSIRSFSDCSECNIQGNHAGFRDRGATVFSIFRFHHAG